MNPWFHLSHVLAAGTGQSTTPSWLLWMFSFENYAHQWLDHRQKLIGVRLGTGLFIFGMNGSKTLFQMHAPIHGLKSHAKINGISQVMLPLYLLIGGFNLVLVAWAVHDIRGNQHVRRIGSTHILDREAALDDVVWNSHFIHLSVFAACK